MNVDCLLQKLRCFMMSHIDYYFMNLSTVLNLEREFEMSKFTAIRLKDSASRCSINCFELNSMLFDSAKDPH